MLAKKYPADFDSAEVARDAVRYQRGAAGPTPRMKAHTTPPAEAREMPKSLAEPWTPFELGEELKVLSLRQM